MVAAQMQANLHAFSAKTPVFEGDQTVLPQKTGVFAKVLCNNSSFHGKHLRVKKQLDY